MENEIKIHSERTSGDVALCNLASINIYEWYYSTPEEQQEIAQCAVDALDLAIEFGICPVTEGQITNDEYKYMGIGLTNLTNLLASQQIVIDTKAAAEFQDELMDNLSFMLYRASMLRAKKLGAFKQFKNTKWAEGLTPVHMSLKHFPQAWELTEYGRNFVSSGKLKRWDELAKEIKQYGIRNAQVMAIAPTASSGKAINATESTEPVHDLVYKEEGTKNLPALAPNLRQNHLYYKSAFDCDQKALLTNAIVRNRYLDQGQSITLYFKKVDSLREFTDLHTYAMNHGVKSLYYVKTQKATETEEECVACAV